MGRNKAFVALGRETLLSIVLRRLSDQVSPVAISSNDPLPGGLFANSTLIADRDPSRSGPLSGILAAMEWAAGQGGISHVLSVPVDTPFFPADLATNLSGAIEGRALPVLARSAGRVHPTVGLWPVALAGELEDFIGNDAKRRVVDFAERHGSVAVDFPMQQLADGRTVDPFFNVNTPAELAVAESLAAELFA